MRRVKNLFLVNLAVADLCMTLLCMPLSVANAVDNRWYYGEFLCKSSNLLQGTTVFASIFTLTALSVDRYFAFKSFMRHRIATKAKAMLTLSLIWILSALCAFPQFLAMRTTKPVTNWPESIYFCTSSSMNGTTGILFRRSYGTCVLIVLYIVPMLVMLSSYLSIARRIWSGPLQSNSVNLNGTSIDVGKRKITKMLFIVVLMFIICWMPYSIMSFVMDLTTGEETATTIRMIFNYVLLLAHANCAVNPILYWVLNKSFRHCMQNLMGCKAGITDSPSIRRKDRRAASQKFRIVKRRGRVHRPELIPGGKQSAIKRPNPMKFRYDFADHRLYRDSTSSNEDLRSSSTRLTKLESYRSPSTYIEINEEYKEGYV
ncbi:DgyrCDS5648 [Dimorphilus gyrociliatus]|uniref:DgyrCDS5648 n=1 Tax=Dimorphilus gyrociliatus TaxID=2664684 RepID=A0A7I8VKP0_9ANNE|nr:DgyrCDS5648 [Dimorphilus gyrociliatus]